MNLSNTFISTAARALALSLLLAFGSVAAQSPPSTAPSPAAEKVATVGPLQFRLASLRVSTPDFQGGNMKKISDVLVTLEIVNQGSEPIALGYISRSARMADDKGYSYASDLATTETQLVSGVGIIRSRQADNTYIAEPQQPLRTSFRIRGEFRKGQSPGDQFDFTAEFAEIRDLGEGTLEIGRRYPLSLIGMQRSSVGEVLSDTPKEIGSELKKAFGGLFR